jgi:acid phosphatase
MMPLICHNQSLPCKNNECMTMEEYEIILQQNNKENQYFFRKDLARFQVGFFVDEMLMDYDDALKNGRVILY